MVSVSIITATYNSEEQLLDTYQSLFSQTYTDWEWVITDDCSSDGTIKIIQDIAAKDERVKYNRLDVNSGAAIARNSSIVRANGRYIAFVDSDDLWLPSKLAKQIAYMENNRFSFSFTAYELISFDGRSLKKTVDMHNTHPLTYDDMLLKKATIGCSTVMIRREAFDDMFMPEIRTGQDYALWLKLLKSGVSAVCYNEVLTQYRITPNSISRNKFKKAKRQWQIYRKLERLGLIKAAYCFCFYAFRAVFKK